MTRQVLVLGANGRCGRAVAEAFTEAGWTAHAQVRRAWGGRQMANLRPLPLGLEHPAELIAAARGASIVVHALNPLYTRWDRELLPLGEAALAIARGLGATLMLPGNVYNFGDPIAARLSESTPYAPNHPKARLRCELERRLSAAPDVRTIVVRAGDFFGSGRGNWIDEVMLTKLARGRIVYPGPLGTVHTWAYLPDLGRTFVALAERAATLPAHATLHFPGHALTGQELVEAFACAARERGLLTGAPHVRALPWGLLRLAGLVSPLLRELVRMSYLWRQPHRLTSERLEAAIGPVPHTPLGAAALATVDDLFGEPGAARTLVAA
jgi:nucleoside-diphosphate-sugar epimerase